MSDRPVLLVIDDEPGILEAIAHVLEPEFSIHVAGSGSEGLVKVDAVLPDLVLLDLKMPRMSGLTVLRRLREAGRDVPVMILTAYGSVDSAVQAIKLGAVDYIQKPFEGARLRQAVQAFLAGRKSVEELPSRRGIIGESLPMRKVWGWVEKYGPTDLPILLFGETGTGKELFAKAIHEIGKRSGGPFVPVDVSTIPESLVESEIFGYEKGAFTGARGSKSGRLGWANGGTLFLDEIGNLPLSCQAKLLRVLQEEEYVPLGGKGVRRLDVRLVSASNTSLGQAIERGTFRKDLYYRISGVIIELPPLREREGDMKLLAHHFVEKYGRKYGKPFITLSGEAIERLLSYGWPGNVRELEHAIAGSVVLADRVIFPRHLSLPCSTEVSTVEVDRRAPFRLEERVPGSDDGEANEIVFELRFRCDLSRGVDLKRVRKKVATEAEQLIIAEVNNRLSLTQTELAAFLGIDPKTLRGKSRKELEDDDSCGR